MNGIGLLADVALSLLAPGAFDERISTALERLGRGAGVSRAYVFLDRPGGAVTDNTHEWCAVGVPSQRENLQGIPYDAIPSWRKLLSQDGMILAPKVFNLPPDIRAVLDPQGIRSLLVLPLHRGADLVGFIGFDQCDRDRLWDVAELAILRTAFGVLSTVIERDLEWRELASSELNFRRLVETVDYIVLVADGSGKISFSNPAAARRLGYGTDELVGMELLSLHASESRAEAAALLESMSRGEADACPLPLLKKDGGLLPVETKVWRGYWDGAECLIGISEDRSAEQERLRLFGTLFSRNPVPMSLSEADSGRIVDVNDAFLVKTGYERTEILGRTSLELGLFAKPEERDWALRLLRREGWLDGVEVRIRRKDEGVVIGRFSGGIIEMHGRKLLLTVMVDVTEQSELRDRLESQRRTLRQIIDGTRLGTWEWNVKDGRTSFNERWAEIVGYSLAELEPTTIDTWARLLHPDDAAESERLLAEHFDGKSDYYEFEGRMRHKDGSYIWVLDRGKVTLRDEGGSPLMMFGTHQDITERRLMEERIRELSIRDPLTGAYNRRRLFEDLGVAAADYGRSSRPFCVAMFDLDHFKSINDAFGHAAGDEVLKAFAALVKAMIRPYDVFGRYGGEEFTLIMPACDKDQAEAALGRILDAIRALAVPYGQNAIRLTASCGYMISTELEPNAIVPDAAIALADGRLLAAKRGGRDRLIGPG